MSNEYWFCIIGPATRDKMPINGADGPLRNAVQRACEDMLKTVDYTTSSGWGVSEIQKEAMELARIYPEKVIKLLKNASI